MKDIELVTSCNDANDALIVSYLESFCPENLQILFVEVINYYNRHKARTEYKDKSFCEIISDILSIYNISAEDRERLISICNSYSILKSYRFSVQCRRLT